MVEHFVDEKVHLQLIEVQFFKLAQLCLLQYYFLSFLKQKDLGESMVIEKQLFAQSPFSLLQQVPLFQPLFLFHL